MRFWSKYILVFLLVNIGLVNNLLTQEVTHLHKELNQLNLGEIIKVSPNAHTSIKPLFYNSDISKVNIDTLISYKNVSRKRWVTRKLFFEHLIQVDTTDLIFNVDFLTDLEDCTYSDSYYAINTRGVQAEGIIGKKLYFRTSFNETQIEYPKYISDNIKKYGVIPGGTWIKVFKSDSSIYDYGTSRGLISYSPNKNFNFQFGNDNLFIGHGYRSLFLSDNTSPHLFLRLTYTKNKFQYTNITTSYSNPNLYLYGYYRNWDDTYINKTGSYNFLSYNLFKGFNIGLFEGVIFEAGTINKNKFHINKLNPLIFSRSLIYGLDHRTNVITGVNLRYLFLKKYVVYGQYLVDDLESIGTKNKTGYQIGCKLFDAFRLNNLYIQVEYNNVDPYTYSHNNHHQSYSHYVQPLAHPLGANFSETVGIINYRYKNWFSELKVNYLTTEMDADSTSNIGQDIFKADQKVETNNDSYEAEIINIDFRVQYVINPKTNMNVFVGFRERSFMSKPVNDIQNYFYMGIKTSLKNLYYDN